MGYMHIDNLYKNQDVLLFRECYALEKIHGTSAHVHWNGTEPKFFAGGESHERFVQVFPPDLAERFAVLGHPDVYVYGEAYGGKCQGMSATYGKELRFVVFDVRVGETWLNVPNAADVAIKLGLEFVAFERIPTTLEAIDAQRDADSVQAVRNGTGPGHKREGVVLRPLFEFTKSNGERIISKHKRDEFRETATPRKVDPEKAKVLEAADAIAFEWVTPTRLQHVLDKLPEAKGPEHTGLVIKAMTEDVLREGAGEIVDSKDARKAIGKRAAALFGQRIRNALREGATP